MLKIAPRSLTGRIVGVAVGVSIRTTGVAVDVRVGATDVGSVVAVKTGGIVEVAWIEVAVDVATALAVVEVGEASGGRTSPSQPARSRSAIASHGNSRRNVSCGVRDAGLVIEV